MIVSKLGSRIATIFTVIIISSSLMISSGNYAFAHNFAPNESAQFLGLMQLIESEINLVKSISSNDTKSANSHADVAINVLTPTIIKEIQERNKRVANDLTSSLKDLSEYVSTENKSIINNEELTSKIDNINAIIGETISARIDPEQMNNITIKALSFAGIMDKILENYGDAFAVGFDMTNMSNMGGMSMGNDSSMGGMSMGNDSGKNNAIQNMTAYQTALALAEKSKEIYNTEIKPAIPANSTASSISTLEEGLIQLDSSIKNKSAPMDVMMIVHGKIHPNLLTIFNLPLVSQQR
ncbi:MAG: hypothetical protein R2685_02590 [Candidatus Nitrosocosmicus sp.]|nr:hypothetical protein [Candidatus Nitrosocosmicus sp.]